MTKHVFTIMSPDEVPAVFNWGSAIGRRARWAKMLARGKRISADMLAFAAGSRARLAQIDLEYPETHDD